MAQSLDNPSILENVVKQLIEDGSVRDVCNLKHVLHSKSSQDILNQHLRPIKMNYLETKKMIERQNEFFKLFMECFEFETKADYISNHELVLEHMLLVINKICDSYYDFMIQSTHLRIYLIERLSSLKYMNIKLDHIQYFEDILS